ncbi:MAG: RNA polymerase-binding protein RbpA [Actinomycetaceae bacterium]|nr:RNA polymerase-binding protein RbpA [Actinomycetaceae bacterium]
MAERSLRGMRIGTNSLETENGVRFVARHKIYYVCPNNHEFAISLVLDAQAPPMWECRCGQKAHLRDSEEETTEKATKPARTHWDMLLERRSEEELKELLNERLELLKAGKLSLHPKR